MGCGSSHAVHVPAATTEVTNGTSSTHHNNVTNNNQRSNASPSKLSSAALSAVPASTALLATPQKSLATHSASSTPNTMERKRRHVRFSSSTRTSPVPCDPFDAETARLPDTPHPTNTTKSRFELVAVADTPHPTNGTKSRFELLSGPDTPHPSKTCDPSGLDGGDGNSDDGSISPAFSNQTFILPAEGATAAASVLPDACNGPVAYPSTPMPSATDTGVPQAAAHTITVSVSTAPADDQPMDATVTLARAKVEGTVHAHSKAMPATPPHVLAGFETPEDYEIALLKHAQSLEGTDDGDYSDAVGGSLPEYQEEKAFEQLLAGTEGETKDGPFAFRKVSPAQLAAGRWIRTLNSKGQCYLYVHTVSHEIRGQRPPDYDGPDDVVALSESKAEPKASESFPTVALSALESAVRAARDRKVLPLVLASTAEAHAAAVQAMSGWCNVLDLRPLALPFARTKIKPADAVEAARQMLVAGMKEGTLVALDIGDRCPDFHTIATNPKFARSLPLAVLDPTNTSLHETLFHRGKGDGEPTMAPGFGVFVLAQVLPSQRRRELGEHLPLERCAVLALEDAGTTGV